MKNSEYWRNRLIEVKKHQINADNAYLGALEVEYKIALHSISEDVETWFARLAKNNDISLAAARKLLSANELEEFHWTVQEYIKHGKENGISNDWSKQLENASARVHISRFEALKTQIRGELEKLNTVQTEGINAHLSEAFTETYYHTAYEIQTGVGVGIQLNRFSVSDVEKVLKKPWTPDKNTFRDRCWLNKEKLISELETGIAQSLIRGDSPDSLIRQISDRHDVEMHKAATLVSTESAYFASAAEDACYQDLGVVKYEINSVLDKGTCAKCGGLDGKVFDMKDHVIGTTAPPFHPRCRCDKVPHFNDSQGERFAREADGKRYYIPQDTQYKDWEKAFVKGDKSGFTAVENDGIVSWLKDKPAKKEYLTKKKLAEKISAMKDQIKVLDEVNGTPEELQQYQAITQQMSQYQEMLDKKVLASQKKSLAKQEVKLQSEFDSLLNKTYSGIWKDDVQTSDWGAKQGSIQAKKEYFQQQLNSGNGNAEKWKQLIAELNEFDAEGKHYFDVHSKLKQTKAELISLKNSGIIKGTDNPFTQERKDAALWAKSTKEADSMLRQQSGDVWKSATAAEKDAIHEYTYSYSKFNEPLRGYEYGTNAYLGVGKVDLEKIGINYGGFEPGQVKKQIDAMTAIIGKSAYSSDIWVQRGVDYKGMDNFFGINPNDFKLSEVDLAAKLLGTTPTDYGFFSTGVSKGKGFSGKPIIMNVYAPAGTKMMYAEPFSYFGNGSGRNWDGISSQSSFGSEAEMIFQRETTFRVIKVEKANGKIYIDLEVIGQGVG